MHNLTLQQTQAVHYLNAGYTDAATARAVGVHRSTIHRWKIYQPCFLARLNALRTGQWIHQQDFFRAAILPAAIANLHTNLHCDNPARRQAATHLALRLAGSSRLAPPPGPDSTFEILTHRRQRELKLTLSDKEFPSRKVLHTDDLATVCLKLDHLIQAPPDELALTNLPLTLDPTP
jgi:hypothetical protein